MALRRDARLAGMSLLFEHVTVVDSVGEREAMVRELGHTSEPLVVSFINAHAANLAWSDQAFRAALSSSDVLFRDGIGMAIALPGLGLEPGMNLNGTDLIPDILRAHAHRSIALAGSTSACAEEAANRLRTQLNCRVIAAIDGFRTDDTYSVWAHSHRPEVIVLGMGMPKQERLALRLRSELDHPCLIINGGAVLDFLAGRVDRAPCWARAARMEWVYRLVHEPRRLWRRYILGNPLFLLRALRVSVWRHLHSGRGWLWRSDGRVDSSRPHARLKRSVRLARRTATTERVT